jgi:hypothetical protein
LENGYLPTSYLSMKGLSYFEGDIWKLFQKYPTDTSLKVILYLGKKALKKVNERF